MSNSTNEFVLYTQNDCPYCDIMKKKLDDWKLSYETINISEDLPARAFLKDNNHRTVPQLYFGDIHLNKVDTRDFTRDMIMKEIQLQHDENDSGVEFFA